MSCMGSEGVKQHIAADMESTVPAKGEPKTRPDPCQSLVAPCRQAVDSHSESHALCCAGMSAGER